MMVTRLQKLNSDFKGILTNLSAIADTCGCRIYLVGGVVRDLLLGRKIFDLDIVVEGDAIAFAQSFAQKYRKEFKRHHAFGTATVYFDAHHLDFATARKETYSLWGALPKVTPATVREDLLRRDFTINAMAISLNKEDYGRLIDFYAGLTDLKKKSIRVLHNNSFLDDPTRILRAIRFEQRFSFRIEKNTLFLAESAIAKGALGFVNAHRLREELIPILKEDEPYCHIKRMQELGSLSFISRKFKLSNNDFKLILNVQRATVFYKKRFKRHRRLEEWVVYLAALLIKLTREEALNFLERFGLRKGERIRILSIYANILRIKRLNKKLQPHAVYRLLNHLSFESIIFFYAYHPERNLRRNIELFLDTLVHVRLQVKGEDLKNLGYKPYSLYGEILEKLLYAKLDKGFTAKKEEIEQVKLIYEKLSQKANQ